MKTYYKVFDHTIQSSNLALSLLSESPQDETSDIYISESDFRQWPSLPSGLVDTPFIQVLPNDLRIFVHGLLSMRIADGSIIQWSKDSSETADEDISTLVLGSGLGAIFIQRNYLVLHGNCIPKDGLAIACLGSSGIGKSTLAFSLLRHGWKLLSDDLVVIDSMGFAIPGLAQVKLWSDVAKHYHIPNSYLQELRSRVNKYSVKLEGSLIESARTKVDRIYILHNSQINNSPTYIHQNTQSSFESIKLVLENLYRPRFYRGLKKEGPAMVRICKLIESVQVNHLVVPYGLNNLDQSILEVCRR